VRAAPRVFPAADDAWREPGPLAEAIATDLPEALVCYDDKLALSLMDALRRLGIRVPDDVAIVGFDGIPSTAISNPRLTTVTTPSGEMGRLAAASLIRAIKDGSPPEGRRLEPELVVRESTRARD
jgi:DNA-binding LacI/PurR family transcriptional regulator